VTLQLEWTVASAILTGLEDLELPLLSWGVTSGTLAHDEVLGVINDQLAAGDARIAAMDPDDVLQVLLRQALLFQIPATSPPRYRTRLAEALRLTTELRQLFPPPDLDNPPSRWWDLGRPLVADYRLYAAPRRYPSRNVPVSVVLDELGQLPGWGPLHGDVAQAQIDERPLARFQIDATQSIFESLTNSQGRGIIVGAGTGSGKSLAFYLPAFASMAQTALPGQFRLHTVALYPRKELLRDQLRDAVHTALMVSDVLGKAGRRPLRIGALYGDTPYSPDDGRLLGNGSLARAWRRDGQDLVCPYFSCPECGKDLVWPEAERARGREMLQCRSCGLRLEDQVALTRNSLRQRPPDLLFTTTEMLNRCASDGRLGRLLGWQGGVAPALVLLDEVHTYSGVHGAQVALLLRRWRNDVRTPVTFVGLSATLRNAGAFFAELTGLGQAAVDYIEPKPDDLEVIGREYAVALRGDPVSGVSLLSTSIQAAMLFGRILDMPGREYVHGSRGFIFTDDLDVTNRFYDDLRDAEGAQPRWVRGRRSGQVLAGLRSPDAPFASQRFNDGQSWDLVQKIGHPLSPRADANGLNVGRTSSQDSGVDRNADLVVATASLEVGYNDSRVGLVLQHKAPHDPAAFVQRRGRAGRRREMRPWTVVTLSDYGRDRLAYQAYDLLFTPEIPPRHLPVGNRFVLKIHATQALLDWLGRKLTSKGHWDDPRQLLRAPRKAAGDQTQSVALIDLLDNLLRDGGLQDDLAAHLRRALLVSAEEVTALLWEQPRALLLGVVPTALRRLRSNWNPVAQDPGANPGDLLPEYITSTLFDALNVPQVWLTMPFAGADEEALSIEKALREAVPGRVSRRYGHRSEAHRTWLPLPPAAAAGALDIATFTPAYTRQGTWLTGSGDVEVIRPHVLRLEQPPAEISDRAQGTPIWASQLLPSPAGLFEADVPHPSPWAGRITSVGFATHVAGNPAEVRRMTLGAQCETTYTNGRNISATLRYTFEGRPAALGFRLTVDAIRFSLAPLDLTDAAVARHLNSAPWRSLAFVTSVKEDPDLNDVANTFQRDWLILVYLTAFALAGLDTAVSAQQVHAGLVHGAWAGDLPSILQVLYRDANPVGQAPAPQRLIGALTDLSQNPRVRASLDRHGQLLWTPDVAQRSAALAQRAYRDTVAAALLAAAQRACPDAQDDDLIVDVVPGSTPTGGATVWLSETSIGGLGVTEQLARYYAQDPRRFWGLVESALAPSDLEYVDAALTRLLEHVAGHPHSPAAQAMRELRDARSACDADAALSDLRAAWAVLDGYPRHAAVAALSNRLLRPGTARATDLTALAMVRAWSDLEQRLGFEVDARVIAYAVGSQRLNLPGAASTPTADQVFSMLWPRGNQARVQHLKHYQPYAEPPVLDRLLAAAAHEDRLPCVDVTTEGWQDAYVQAITASGAVELEAPSDRSQTLADAVHAVAALAIDRDVLRVYGDIVRVRRAGNMMRARIEIREAVQ